MSRGSEDANLKWPLDSASVTLINKKYWDGENVAAAAAAAAAFVFLGRLDRKKKWSRTFRFSVLNFSQSLSIRR